MEKEFNAHYLPFGVITPHKLGTIFASTTESDAAILAGERVPIKCEESVIHDLNNTLIYSPFYSSIMKDIQT